MRSDNIFMPKNIRREMGFSLIEAVVGMVVLAIALTMMTTLLFPLAKQSAGGLHRAKSAQLGQAVLAELAGRRLDVATPVGGGSVAVLTCGSTGASGDPGDWELLDDFHNFDDSADRLFGGEIYKGYRVQIAISCRTDLGWRGDAKLMQVTVIAPDDEQFEFAQLRGNF